MADAHMNPVTRGQKLYFLAVGLLALWVGIWGFFFPGQVDKAIPWLVPPLHARFIGAIYIAGTIMMAMACISRTYRAVHVPAILSAVWTGSLFIISLFYLDEFDFTRGPVWFWFAAYLVYPLIGTWIAWTNRNARTSSASPDLPGWIRIGFLLGGLILALLALALLFMPEFMMTLWPWKVTRLLIQIYSGPFLAIGIAGLLLSRAQSREEVHIVVSGMVTLAICVLTASFIHMDLFTPASPSTRAWFGGFLILLLVSTGMLLSLRSTVRRSP